MNTVYPYKTLFGDVVLTVRRVLIDGQEPGQPLLFSDRRQVDLRDVAREGWQTASIVLEITGPASELVELDKSNAGPQAVSVMHCAASNHRQALLLERSREDPASWSGTVDIERSQWFERIDLRAFITATIEEIPHRVIGLASPWTMYLDDRERSPVHGSIRVRWEDFSQPDADPAFLRRYREDPWFLVLDPDDPILYLNQGFHGLEALLGDRRRRERGERVLHDQTRASIATDVWIAMFNSALAGVEKVDEGPPGWPDGWREVVLRALLDRMYPERTVEDALEEIWQAREQPDGLAEVQQLLLPAAAQQVGAPKLLRKGIVALGAEQHHGEAE